MVQPSHSFMLSSMRSLFLSLSSARLSLIHPSPNSPPNINSYLVFSF